MDLQKECHICWSFIRRDLFAVLLPGVLFSTRAIISHPTSPLYLLLSLIYFTSLLLFFCTSNQLIGIEEDKVNKPDRPLSLGIITVRQTWYRCIASGVVALGIGFLVGVVPFTLLFMLCTYLHNFCRWGDHWFWKNVLVALGIFSTLCAGWTFIEPLPSKVLLVTTMISVFWALLAHIQDLRDIQGDRASGRRTLPIVLGEKKIRLQLSFFFVVLSLCIPFQALLFHSFSFATITLTAIACGISLSIALRVIVQRSERADDTSYSLFTYLYCTLLLLPLT